MAKWVYMFTEGNADMRNLLGGKGANLAEMTNLQALTRLRVYKGTEHDHQAQNPIAWTGEIK